MAEMKFTPDQQQAIEAGGQSVLVSAAAGSGKTSVLTQRLLTRVKQGENIDRFLVITFTRAAAAELRARILDGLTKLAAEDPGNAHIRRQTALLYRAQIGTIDSFCTAVVRENAHIPGISPAFGMADDDRAKAMKAASADEVLNRAYERLHSEPDSPAAAGLRQLIDSIGAGRDDQRLVKFVLEIYEKLQSRPNPHQWAEDAVMMLAAEGITDAGETVWGRFLLEEVENRSRACELKLEDALKRMDTESTGIIRKGYEAGFEAAADLFRSIQTACDRGWDAAREALYQPYPKAGRVTIPKSNEDPDLPVLKDYVKKQVFDKCKTWVTDKFPKWLAADSDKTLSDLRASQPAMRALIDLVFETEKEYTDRKRRADLCDFSDMEHFCVEMLCDENGGPSELAHKLSGRFAEVMVDEYQDINEVQETIFQRVSGEGQRLFMVGDVKQSIYRFRLAEPGIFNRKYNAFADGTQGTRVLLRANFRSRPAVLAACNSVFEKIMSEDLGEIVYDELARLDAQAKGYDPAGEVPAELVVVAPDADGTGSRNSSEARYVAARIREMVDSGQPVTEKDGSTRPMNWGDIAILLRAPTSSAPPYHKALLELGIPSMMDRGESFLMLPEVSFALQMLIVADNPRQDIPLVGALRGAPFAFTPDELAAIRAQSPNSDLWDALRERARTDEKCARFIELLRDLRGAAADEPMQVLLQRLYDRTDLMSYCAALPDGDEHIAGLMRLYDYACRFEKSETRGLNRFTAWLARLEEQGMKQVSGGSRNSVRIMSIHKSKGLEFPVVFMPDCAHLFRNETDAQVLCHSELGLGMKMTDMKRGLYWPTLPFTAISRKTHLEDRSEQERVLYVAMTRAKERLIMTCKYKPDDVEKLRTEYEGHTGPIAPEDLSEATSHAEWLLRAAICDGGETIALKTVTEVAVPQQTEALPEMTETAPADSTQLRERLAWHYPEDGAVGLPSKLTATELKETGLHIAQPDDDPESADLLPKSREHLFRVPDFGAMDRPLTGAERGTAEHLVMQYIDFARTDTLDDIAAEIERMHANGLLDDRQAAAIPPRDIFAFFHSQVGREMLAAERVEREFRFSLLCPAKRWYEQAGDGEQILLQGVIDCWFDGPEGITVIDFKTDAEIEPEYYTAQVEAYAEALRRITGRPVRRAALWYLRRKKLVEIAFGGET